MVISSSIFGELTVSLCQVVYVVMLPRCSSLHSVFPACLPTCLYMAICLAFHPQYFAFLCLVSLPFYPTVKLSCSSNCLIISRVLASNSKCICVWIFLWKECKYYWLIWADHYYFIEICQRLLRFILKGKASVILHFQCIPSNDPNHSFFDSLLFSILSFLFPVTINPKYIHFYTEVDLWVQTLKPREY